MNRLQLANVKLNKTRIAYLKNEMFAYKQTKKALDKLENLTTSQIIYMQNVVRAIESALKLLEGSTHGHEKRKIIEDMYWRSTNYNLFALSNKHKMHANTVFYWNKEFLILFGQQLGLKII
jgi:GMP synthase PP-ATPase subunit